MPAPTEEEVAEAKMNPAFLRVMGVLGRRGLEFGSYASEDVDTMERLELETTDVLNALIHGESLGELLIDTGWWNPANGPFPLFVEMELAAVAT